jgi:N-acetylneuraminate synthase
MLTIDDIPIGDGFPPYVIAELSANHNGLIDRALESIKKAKDCGAQAVKLQTYTADTMTINSDRPGFVIENGLWAGYRLYDLYKEAHTPYEWHEELFTYAKEIGITIFSTPFDSSAVDLLENLNSPAYKIASFELVDLPLIKLVASTGKPLFMSTGMATEQEIYEAVETARSAGCNSILLFHCISSYPTPIDQSNLKKIVNLKDTFQVEIGLSDHTLGTTAAITSIALGASAIEKHFTLNRSHKGPDSNFSIEPNELKLLTTGVKDAWLSLGNPSFSRPDVEDASQVFKRSIYFVKPLKRGQIISRLDIRCIRPGFGLPPKYFDQIIGRVVIVDVLPGTPVSLELLS